MLQYSDAGVSVVSNLKKGQMPSADRLAKIANYLEVSTDFLLGNEQSKATRGGLSIEITNDEILLLENYRTLNAQGQERVTNYVDDLITSGKYSQAKIKLASRDGKSEINLTPIQRAALVQAAENAKDEDTSELF